MKKFLRTGKKALAVFMAVMMVMTAWVFFEPTKAEAADNACEINGHSYGNGIVTRQADAGNNGLIVHTCSVCGDEYYEEYVLNGTEHDWSVDIVISATCSDKGLAKFTCVKPDCTICTDESKVSFVKQIPALGHNLSEKTVAATCTSDGSKTVTCSRCDYSETTVLPSLGHDYVAGTEVPAKCETPGYIPHICSRCGDTYNTITGKATGHIWSEWTETVAASEDASGAKERTCTACGKTQLKTVEPTGSHYFALEREIKPDCENAGEKVWKCSDCLVKYTEVVPATGHTITKSVVSATCESPAFTKYACANDGCGKNETIVTAPALGHVWGEWKTTTPATCSERGVETRTCLNNPTHIQTRRTNTVDHDFVSTLYHPTCTDSGFTIFACKGCGKTIRTDFVPAYGHKYDEGVYEDATCTTPGGIRYTCTNTNPDGTPCGHSYLVKDTEPLGHTWGAWHYVEHPTVDGAYAKQRDCTRGGCTVIEYERGKMANEDDINVYYKVEFFNPWTTASYETDPETGKLLNNGRTKLAKTYKTEKVNEAFYLAGDEVTYPSKVYPQREKDYTWGGYKLFDWTYDEHGQTDSALEDMKSIGKNMAVYANFEGYDVYYKVRFWNGATPLTSEKDILHGHPIDRPSKDPTKDDNLHYKYEFTGWDYDYEHIYDSVAICAMYDQVAKSYTVEYCDWNGTLLAKETFEYGEPAKNNPTGLERPEDATYIYQFSGKWQTQQGKEEYIDLNHLTVPVGTKEGDTVKVYAKYYQKAKSYVVNIYGYGINKEPIPGATVQIFGSNGQIVTTTKLKEDSSVTVSLYYDTAYQFIITDDSGNVGTKVCELNTSLYVKDENGNDTNILVPTPVTVYLTQYEDPDHGGSDCHCICHSFFGGLWISILNLIYNLFGKKTVCCYDMFATHGDRLVYGK